MFVFYRCDATCKVEPGWTCVGGSSTTPTICKEICGDGRNMGQFACDDANTKNGDGCSSICAVETGWTCSGGTPTKSDTCKEICGDGKDFGSYACDDGNNLNGDGCTEFCTIEAGYQCKGGTTTTPDVCSYYPGPLVSFAAVNANNTKMEIVFNDTIYLTSNWSDSDWGAAITGPYMNYGISWNIDQEASLKASGTAVSVLFVNLNITGQLYGGDLEQLTFSLNKNTHLLSSKYQSAIANTTISAYLNANNIGMQ
jgi:cysteine-rich repeat protein